MALVSEHIEGDTRDHNQIDFCHWNLLLCNATKLVTRFEYLVHADFQFRHIFQEEQFQFTVNAVRHHDPLAVPQRSLQLV